MSGAPFFAGTIEGVRAWSLSDDFELRGRGMGSSEAWAADGSTTEAACLHHDHPAPEPDAAAACTRCILGLEAPSGPTHSCRAPGVVAGVVEAWGRIELHEVGFRAQFARPKLLFEPAPHLISQGNLAAIHEAAQPLPGASCAPTAARARPRMVPRQGHRPGSGGRRGHASS